MSEIKENTIDIYRNEVMAETSTKSAQQKLLATVFSGFKVEQMQMAILEGRMRGFTFQDFLNKKVYPIKYGNTYSLVTSIDHNRKIGMKNGVVGISTPTFVTEKGKDGKEKIISCSVTVKKIFPSSHIGEFTAEVYFDEYTTGKNLWLSKPRTMIAKVAEMHALRKACPEDLSQHYTAEEMEKETINYGFVDSRESETEIQARAREAVTKSKDIKMGNLKTKDDNKKQTDSQGETPDDNEVPPGPWDNESQAEVEPDASGKKNIKKT